MVEDKIAKEYERLVFDVKYDLTKIKDELASGLLLYRLSKEREASNAILSSVETKLNQIIALLEPSRVGQPIRQELARALSEVDQKIISHIQRQGRADAQQIQQAFQYKGKNAATQRLNALYLKGLLLKARAGRKVYYWAPGYGLENTPLQ